jgi:hypothetical protein
MNDTEFKKKAALIGEKRTARDSEEAAEKQREKDLTSRRADESRRLREKVIGPALVDAARMLNESGVRAQAHPYDPNCGSAFITLLEIMGTPELHFERTTRGDLISVYERRSSQGVGGRIDVPFEKITREFVLERVLKFAEARGG